MKEEKPNSIPPEENPDATPEQNPNPVPQENPGPTPEENSAPAPRKKKNYHQGHRKRQKQKYLEVGLNAFTDVEVLEFLLYFSISRQNTNLLAHELLDHFKGMQGVLSADPEELQKIDGVGEASAILISLAGEMGRRYSDRTKPRRFPLRSAEAAGAYLLPFFNGLDVEKAVLLCLDHENRIIAAHDLGKGTSVSVMPSLQEIIQLTIKDKASRALIAHNHVGSVALPSVADADSTRRLYYALNLIGVELMDHIIVAEDDFVSLRESGFFAAL